VGIEQGRITLLAGMAAGAVDVGGTLDASAPHGGNGGFIETSAAHVEVAADAKVTTAAPSGLFGTWLIDPQDFTIAANGGDMTGATLSSALGTTSVSLDSSAGTTAGSGNINVNDAVAWAANNVLTFTASNNVNINANIAATGNSAGLVINPNTPNGSELASGTGIYTLQRGVSITLSGAAPSLSIGGSVFTVLNTLGASGSVTGTDLQGINGGLTGHYALGSNIDANATKNWNGTAGFAPIGTSTPFTGTFDGLGHTISNLMINLTTLNVGLFGDTGAGAAIRNVGLIGGSVTGGAGTGGLVGNNGIGVPISGSYNTGSVSGAAGTGGLVGSSTTGAITDSYATGSVSGAAGTGGLVGSNTDGAISNSYSTGNVDGHGGAGVGGLVGSSTSGAISNSYATGSVVHGAAGTGGLIGSNTSGPISDSYATGNVDGAGGAGVGGLIGSNTSGAISKSYATGSVIGAAGTGGLIGSNTSGPISDSYATGNVNGDGAGVGGLIGSTSGDVTNSYAVGGVIGSGAGVGALLGSSTAAVTNSYWDKTTSLVQSSVGGGVGMTTAQMMMKANFAWDFANTWVMYDGSTMPLLQVFMTPLTVSGTRTQIYNGGVFAPTVDELAYSIVPDTSHLFGTVTVSGTASGALNVGTYRFTPGGLYSDQGGYLISYALGTLTINPAPLTVLGQSAVSKVYDGTSGALLLGGSLSGVLGGDAVTLSATPAGSFASPNVGTGIGVTASDTLVGTSAAKANYTLSQPTGLAADITPASLTVLGQSAVSKVYDGTSGALLLGGSLVGVLGGDAVTLSATPAGSFASQNVGNGIGVTASDILGGAGAGNYTVSQPTILAANITAAPLTVAGQSAGDKVYDRTPSAVLTGGTLNGVFTGDTVTLTQAGSFASPNVGNGIGVTASDVLGGTGAGNYRLIQPTGLVADITPAMLTYTAFPASFVAGQTPSGLSGTLSGFVSADNQANAAAGTLDWTTTATGDSKPGYFPIDGGGLKAMNYLFIQAPGDAIALTLQSGSPPLIPSVILPLSGPDAAMLVQAQTAAGTLDADLLSSQTNMQQAPPVLNRDLALAQSTDCDQGGIRSYASNKGNIAVDKSAAINAIFPSLRIVCGGVKLPDNVLDVNAL
jgi:hypothetical protein